MPLNFKPMKTARTLLWLALELGLNGCEGIERSVVEIANVPTSNLPFVTSFISPQDSVLRVKIEQTVPVVGQLPANTFAGSPVTGATVSITNGLQSVTLPYNERRFEYQTKPRSFTVIAGGTYQLTIRLKDGATISSSCTIPSEAVPLQSIRIIRDPNTPKVRFTWPDLPGPTNFYATSFYLFRLFSDGTVDTTGDRLEEVFSAESDSKGGRFITKLVDPVSFSNERNALIISRTDKLYYEYHRALSALVLAKDNPFADPIRLPSNMQGAYGVFCGYTRTTASLRL